MTVAVLSHAALIRDPSSTGGTDAREVTLVQLYNKRGLGVKTLVYALSPMATRVLPGGTVRSRRPSSPPGGLFRVGPGRARPTVVRESSKVNWLNVCRPSDGHPRHPTWTTPPAGSPVLHMLVEQ